MRKAGGSGADSPLFLTIFLLMLFCVAVVQLLNLAALIAVQAPKAKLYTVGQVAQAIQQPHHGPGPFDIRIVAQGKAAPWSPRAERIQKALATALGVRESHVIVSFPPPPLQRQPQYDQSSVPPTPPFLSAAAARDVVIMSDFTAQARLPSGRWIVVSAETGEPWRWFVLLWLLLSAIAVAPFAWTLAQRFAKPIGAFAAAADRLGRDPRAPPLELTGPPEIADAARALNRMQARLNRYVEDRAMMIAAVAHDLRTPLMRLGLRLEAAPPEVRSACEGDIRDMQAMISAVMAYVRDRGDAAVRRQLDLRSLAETVVDEAFDRGEAVALEPGDPMVITGDPVALKRLLTNLVSNAVKYAGGAEVELAREAHQVIIEVRDQGPGIAEAHLERVFDPFFRGEGSRNRDTGGMGLGLASARAVARAHGGEITLRNRIGGGLRARVQLPA